jgi:hypothetical protein
VLSNQIKYVNFKGYFSALFTAILNNHQISTLFSTMASMELEEQLEEQVYLTDTYVYKINDIILLI